MPANVARLSASDVVKKFRGRCDSRNKQPVARPSCGDIKELALGRDHLVQFELIRDVRDAVVEGQDALVTGHHDDRAEFEPFGQMHRRKEHAAHGPSLALARRAWLEAGVSNRVPCSGHLIMGAHEGPDLVRRNAVVILMSVELMLNATNLALVAFSRRFGSIDERGSVFVVFIFVVAAAEVAVGLAIILSAYRNRPTVDVDEIRQMKG